jgi:hypothetical protein
MHYTLRVRCSHMNEKWEKWASMVCLGLSMGIPRVPGISTQTHTRDIPRPIKWVWVIVRVYTHIVGLVIGTHTH